MKKSLTLLTGILTCALAGGLAFAAPFTSAFDSISGTLAARVAEQEPLSKAQRKLATKSDRLLQKDSPSLKKDIAIGLKINKIEKKFGEDSAVIDGLNQMVTGLRNAAQTRFDDVSNSVDLLNPNKAADKAVKLRNQANDLFTRSDDEETRAKRLKFIKKAAARVEAAAKQVAKANKSGGGGKLACDGRAPGPGESGSIDIAGVVSTANELQTFVDRGPSNEITRFTVRVVHCETNNEDAYRGFDLAFLGEPNVGTYSSTPSSGTGSVFLLVPNSDFSRFTFGTLSITERSNGKIAGSFVTRSDIVPVEQVFFVVDDPDAP